MYTEQGLNGMSIDFIIPAKRRSTRTINKNWRPFDGDKCLVDIVVDKLQAVGVSNIYLSTEPGREAERFCRSRGLTLLPRDSGLSDNSTPIPFWIRSIVSQLPSATSDIVWCQVCDPLFNSYSECLQQWPEVRKQHDSLVVCYPWRGYLMNDSYQPVGWSFGMHHTPSQQLPRWTTMPFTFSLLTRQAVEDTGYHVGRKPFWVEMDTHSIDIDTEQDFEAAQAIYVKSQAVSSQATTTGPTM